MYLGRFRQGDWVTLTFPKFRVVAEEMEFPSPEVPSWSEASGAEVGYRAGYYNQYPRGTENPILSVIDSSGSVVVEDKRMHLLDSNIDPALFTVSLFLGSDIPVGQCVARGEYVSRWKKIENGPDGYRRETDIRSPQTHNVTYPFKVVPSGDPRGTYISSYFYKRPHASFLLGQYDGDTLDFRKNPRE